MMHERRLLLLTVCLIAALSGPALAVDGVIEINQARASSGGITPGDAPGFPITISTGTFANEPMSFRLTGPLFTSTSADMFEILSPHVSIDLNGFTVGCLLPSCSGRGIVSAEINVSVRNGTVRGFGEGVLITGNGSYIENVRATGNIIGLHAGNVCVVRDSIAIGNTEDGIRVGNGCLVSGNTAANNTSDGINTGVGSNVVANTALGNGGRGLNLAVNTAYSQNSINGNTLGTVLNGVSAGLNVCNGLTTCP